MSACTCPNRDCYLHGKTMSDPDNPIRIAQPGPQGPKCIWCTGPTQRTGMCWTCLSCGETTSC